MFPQFYSFCVFLYTLARPLVYFLRRENHVRIFFPNTNPMYNIIYIDEKWFYRTRRNQKYYLANDEERPQRAVKSKNFIEKVMFLAVVTRPRFDADGNCTFDGKLGIFPFVYVEPAKRKSPNRPRGTIPNRTSKSVYF